MESVNYLKIAKEALKIAWDKKYLWVLGLFVFLSQLFSFNFFFNHSDLAATRLRDGFFSKEFGVFSFLDSLGMPARVLFLAFVFSIFFVLGFWSRASLIFALGEIIQKKSAGFRSSIVRGRKFFWKLTGLSLLVAFFATICFLGIFSPVVFLFLSEAYITGLFLGLWAFLIALGILGIAFFFLVYGRIYLILGEIGIVASLENAYKLFQKNIGRSLWAVLALSFLGLVFSLLIILLFVPVAVFFLALNLIFILIFPSSGGLAVAFLGVATAMVWLLFWRSFWIVFSQAFWVLFFDEIAKSKPEEEVVLEEEVEEIPVSGAVKAFREE